MDMHPQVVAGHMALGEAISRLDQEETRQWMDRNRGLYIGPESSHRIAGDVLLEILAAGLETRA